MSKTGRLGVFCGVIDYFMEFQEVLRLNLKNKSCNVVEKLSVSISNEIVLRNLFWSIYAAIVRKRLNIDRTICWGISATFPIDCRTQKEIL